MASYQYVYHMEGVSKTYPGGKKCFENIHLNFLPGVKIGVVGVNGAGKSTLLKIIAGMDKDFKGEAWAAKGAKVGYLAQEPYLDPEEAACGSNYGSSVTYPFVVPAESVFVLGDNRDGSMDSRSIGPIKYSDLLGRAFVVIWPKDDWQWL